MHDFELIKMIRLRICPQLMLCNKKQLVLGRELAHAGCDTQEHCRLAHMPFEFVLPIVHLATPCCTPWHFSVCIIPR